MSTAYTTALADLHACSVVAAALGLAEQIPESEDRVRSRLGIWATWIILVAAVAFVVVVRVRLLDIPLERDEGDFAYAGRLILQGLSPYEYAYNMKFPGIYAAYAGIMAVFGETARGIHLGLLFLNVANIILVFLLGRRLSNNLAGSLAALSYAVMSTSPGVLGTAAHATRFVVLPALGGLLLLLPRKGAAEGARLFAAGALLGFAYLIKQQGAAFALLGLLWVVWIERTTPGRKLSRLIARSGVLIAGLLLPFAAACLVIFRSGSFDKFWFWTFDYASKFAHMNSHSEAWSNFSYAYERTILPFAVIWCLAAAGLAIRARSKGLFLWTLTGLSLLAVCSSLVFHEHYFFLALPAICIAASIAACGNRVLQHHWLAVGGVATLLAGLIYPTWQHSDFLFTMSPKSACRMMYSLNPFPEAVEIADYIRTHTSPGDKVAVMGSESQIYFYSNRRSASSYIFAYAFMENQPYALQMQKEAITQIEEAKPKYLVWVQMAGSWAAKTTSNMHIINWVAQYTTREYDLIGVVDIISENDTITVWGPDAAMYQATPGQSLCVYRRRHSD